MKITSNGTDLQNSLLSGAKKLSAAVGSTLGPRGQNVLIKEEKRPPYITKDGVTVANSFKLSDPIEDASSDIIKQASRRTNIEAGDGTTTSTVLSTAIFEASIKHIGETNLSPVEVFRGLQHAGSEILNDLQELSTPITTLQQIKNIATISANNDPSIGELVAMAVDSVGADGSVTIEESNTSDTSLDLVEGFRLDAGFASSVFQTDERKRIMVYENPLFLITDEKLDSVDQILPSLELAAREARPFIIIADEIEGQALAALIMNKSRGSLKVSAIKSPSYGQTRRDIMEDFAIATGSKYFRKVNGDNLTQVSLKDFGSAKSIRSSNQETIITGVSGKAEKILERIEEIIEQIKSSSDDLELSKRLSRLQSGVGVIKVGGNTEAEVTERRHRIEDALEAVKSAQSEGVVPGASYALLYGARTLALKHSEVDSSELTAAKKILSEAFQAPFFKMLQNAGINADLYNLEWFSFEDLSKPMGLDIKNNSVVDLLDSGIIDPFKVIRCAVKNAISASGNLLTTNYAIIEETS